MSSAVTPGSLSSAASKSRRVRRKLSSPPGPSMTSHRSRFCLSAPRALACSRRKQSSRFAASRLLGAKKRLTRGCLSTRKSPMSTKGERQP